MGNRAEREFVEWAKENNIEVIRGGWPDFLCGERDIEGYRIFCVEVKSDGSKLTPKQNRVLTLLSSNGVQCYLNRGLGLEEFDGGKK